MRTADLAQKPRLQRAASFPCVPRRLLGTVIGGKRLEAPLIQRTTFILNTLPRSPA